MPNLIKHVRVQVAHDDFFEAIHWFVFLALLVASIALWTMGRKTDAFLFAFWAIAIRPR